MRALLLLLAAAVLGVQGWFLADSAEAAARVADEVDRVVGLGDDEASELALAASIDVYPFSPQAFAARRTLAALDGALARRSLPGAPLPLRDPWRLPERPWLGPTGVLALAVVLLLVAVLGPRSRVRWLALLVLLALAAAAALGQGWIGLPAPASDDGLAAAVAGPLETLAWAAYPWVALAGLALAFLLGLAPRRAAR